jgi:recombinational DNA repair ATPase RecF
MVLSNLQEQIAARAALVKSESETARLATANQEIQQMTADFSAKRFLFVKQCFVENKNVNELLIPLLVAARMELELSISKERYAEILHQAYSNQEAHFDEFIQNLAVNVGAPTS